MKMLDKLVSAAKKEDWNFVDLNISKIKDKPDYIRWAYDKGIHDKDKNVRDLGVSILEKAEISKSRFDVMKEELLYLMKSDTNPYVRFRSAFALAAHGASNSEVKKVLLKAKKDPDVADIAAGYLKKIKIE
jgi:hypothetical protein